MTKCFAYRAFGLNIVSDLALPELPPALVPHSSTDLRIELTNQVATGLPSEAESNFHPGPNGGFVMRIADVADFWVGEGSLIRMAVMPDADLGLARLYLLGSAMGMALHQRGWLVMHASAVLRGGEASLFAGDSGAGKSTLAAAFGRAGFGVIADDVLVVNVDPNGRPAVWPGARSFKLWGDTLDALGLERVHSSRIASRTDKYFVINERPITDALYPLAEIVVLEASAEGASASLDTLPRLEAIRAISSNTYRPEYIGLLDRRAEHFRQCAELAAAIPVRRFRRPWDPAEISSGVEILQRL
jgi:hypothetical protein